MLTSRGYYIRKTDCDVDKIRKELWVCPEVQSMVPVQRYKIYRESQESFIVPRFYGINTYMFLIIFSVIS